MGLGRDPPSDGSRQGSLTLDGVIPGGAPQARPPLARRPPPQRDSAGVIVPDGPAASLELGDRFGVLGVVRRLADDGSAVPV